MSGFSFSRYLLITVLIYWLENYRKEDLVQQHLDLSHFALLIFGYMLGFPRKTPRDSSDNIGWMLAGCALISLAWLWQPANGSPGFFAPHAVLAMMLYAAMFALGLVLAWITSILYSEYKRRRIERKSLSRPS
jgi:Zn-dependent protease with chaperone function